MSLHTAVWRNGPASWILLAVTLVAPCVDAQVGHVLNGVGPINQSMAGAGTAVPLDTSGAIHWNPASISGLDSTRIDIGFELFLPETELSSSVNAGAFGAFGPPGRLSGTTGSDVGITPIPSFALVYKPENESRWTFGFGAYGIGGFGVDYEADPGNPITTPQPPNGFGFGRIFSDYQLLQISPTAALWLTDRLSVGFAPTLNWATLEVDPFAAASPDNANGDAFPSYPGTSKSTAWGVGFQLGAYYVTEFGLSLGASIKTPQWFEDFDFNSVDETGARRAFDFNLDYSMILSLGVGQTFLERFTVAADVRWIDYANTDGFGSARFRPDGAVNGFGWQSIFAVALGLQYRASDRLSLRLGYSFNENPVRDRDTFFNVAAPAIVQHHLSAGLTYSVSDNLQVSIGYHHGFENSVRGPFVSPSGPVAGTSIKSELATDGLSFGVSLRL